MRTFDFQARVRGKVRPNKGKHRLERRASHIEFTRTRLRSTEQGSFCSRTNSNEAFASKLEMQTPRRPQACLANLSALVLISRMTFILIRLPKQLVWSLMEVLSHRYRKRCWSQHILTCLTWAADSLQRWFQARIEPSELANQRDHPQGRPAPSWLAAKKLTPEWTVKLLPEFSWTALLDLISLPIYISLQTSLGRCQCATSAP